MSSKQISIKKAALINAVAKYTTVILQLLYTAILSRILSPEEYGIVAIINVFIVFFTLFSDMGLSTGVVQNKSLTKKEVNDIFSCSVYIGIGLMILFIGFSFPLSQIYENEVYIPLGIELAISLMFNTLNMIPNAILLKEKRFFSIAVRTVCVSLLSFLITIFLAIKGFGVFALAANSVFSALGMFVWNQLSVKLVFKIKPSLEPLHKIWSYSIFQFGSQMINYFNRNLDNLLIGRFYSAADLGQYNKAYTLMQYPIIYLPGVITPVLHPILSEHQLDKNYIYDTYIKLTKILSLLGCFGAVFCFFSSREIILIVFGQQWIAAITPFKMLSLSIWAQMLTNTIAPIYQSVGNTKLMFKSTILTTILIVSSIVIGFIGGTINTVAITVSCGYLVNFLLTFFIMIRYCFGRSFFMFIRNFFAEFIIAMVLFVSGLIYPFRFDNMGINLLCKFIYFIIIYVLMLLVTKQYKIFLRIIKKQKKNM